MVDPIDTNVRIYSTIGLSDYSNSIEMKDGTFKNFPVELFIVGYEHFTDIANIAASVSFCISKDKWTCQPGTIFRNVVSNYYNSDMKHIMFISPYLWADKLEELNFGNKRIYCLLLVPISDQELAFSRENSPDTLEELLLGIKNIDLYDINRTSVL